MLKKTISYIDFDGNEQSDTFYFNLSKSELTKMEIREAIIKDDKVTGGLRERLQQIVESGKGRDIMDTFESLLRSSVGERSEDGMKFRKNAEIQDDFMASAAYDVFFMELVTDAQAASNFINAVVPDDIAKQIQDSENVAKVTAPTQEVNSAFGHIPEREETPVVQDTHNVPPLELTPEEIQAITARRNQQADQ